MISNILARANGMGGVVTCMAPDVCLTPSPTGPIPIPYPIVSFLATAQRTETQTMNTSKQVFTMNSRLSSCIGDQAGTAGGVASGTFGGYCRPLLGNMMVLAGGYPVIETGHQFGMNCMGPEGSPNTIGMLAYFE